MRIKDLPTNVKVVMAVAPTAGGTGALTATEVNGTGFDRVLWVLSTGAAGAGATLTPKIQSAVATGMSGQADVVGATFTQITAAAGASKQFVLDMPVNPARPFMIMVGTIATQTLANSAVAILYKGGNYPVATTWATELVSL